jgi:hypothetical protein
MLISIAVASIVVMPMARAQLTLNAGQVFNYGFNPLDLRFTGFTACPIPCFPPLQPYALTSIRLDTNTWADGNRLRLDMFENSPTDSQPSCSVVVTSLPEFGLPGCWRLNGWQDLQGAIRITMEAGSVTVDSISVTAHLMDGAGLDNYAVVLVPEPRGAVFFAILVGAYLGGRAWKAKKTWQNRDVHDRHNWR